MHRLLICAALSKNPSDIIYNAVSKDIAATADSVTALGKRVIAEKGKMRVLDGIASSEINVGESGSTFRFILPVLAAKRVPKTVEIHGSDYLASRPLSPLYETLVSKGAVLSQKGKFPMTVSGKLESGVYTVSGNVSSQFVSGLLLALPLLERNSEIRIEGKLQSEPYVGITLECMESFGVKVEKTEFGYRVRGGCEYVSPGSVECPNDYSNAAFFLVAGALGGGFAGVSGLDEHSAQGDFAVIPVLEQMGAEKKVVGDSVMFARRELRGFKLDASDIPDLVPILSLAASVGEGKSEIFGAERLRFKESDRLKSVCEVLKTLGADIAQTDGGLKITGVRSLKGGRVDSFNDHRIAMTAAIASCVSDGEITVDGFEAVNKSYPRFLDDFAEIGGKFTRR